MHRTPLVALLLALACHPHAAEPARAPGAIATAPAEPALPEPGAAAPAFTLAAIDGTTVTLADALAKGPVVIVFGSFT